MSNETAPKPPPAVRLARVALPDSSFEACPNPDYARHTTPDGALDCSWTFNINSLNDLALAERRVCEAGFGTQYAYALNDALGHEPLDSATAIMPAGLGDFITADAPTRADALIALLDANPELEARLNEA